MKTVIVEDEYLSMVALENMIKHFCPELTIVGKAMSLEEANLLIKKVDPELVFLDIQLSDGLSFELLNGLKNYNFKVVFVTAHNKYALKAFEYAAIHYLLKPVDPDLLQEVITRLKKIEAKTYNLNEHLSILEDLFGNTKTQLIIPTKKEIQFIAIEDLMYCKADTNYTEFHLQSGKIVIASKGLSFFEQSLENMPFVRPHNKFLIHIKYIDKYVRGRGGDLVLTNGKTIPVSVRRKKAFLSKLSFYDPNFFS